MADNLLIRRSRLGKPLSGPELEQELKSENIPVLLRLEAGVITPGKDVGVSELEKRGYRVRQLADDHILPIGKYRIDIRKAAPKVPENLEVPKAFANRWTHYLVQLAAPPEPQWTRAIEDRGVRVVETMPPYGLFVVGDPDRAQALSGFPFVQWVGAFKPAYRVTPRLEKMTGTIKVNIGVLADGDAEGVKRVIVESKGKILHDSSDGNPHEKFVTIIAELNARNVPKIASLPDVRWVDLHPESILLDERSCQIVAEDLDGNAAPNTGPNTGYANTLTTLGVNGTGVTVAVCDSGIDTHANATMQADLAGRMNFFADQTGGAILVDRNGHGTHVTGIAVGNAATGDTDPQGFTLGQGVAPAATFGSINAIAGGVAINLNNWVQAAATNASDVMNNSWGTAMGGVGLFNQGYTALCRTLDQLTRDPDNNTAALESLAIVFAAGNSGSALNTMGEPSEAKNAIIVGNSLNFRPGEGDVDDIRGMRASSSRGPAVDGRTLPNIVAPGTNIISCRPGPTVDSDPVTPGVQRPRTAYTDTGATVHANHFSNSGTSMAAPHVAGVCALLIEWWRGRMNGRTPSTALLKALLINGAIDQVGGPDGRGGNLTNIPNSDQGWGRVSLENMMLQAPDSDRGPKIYSDQRHAFTANGQEFLIRVAAADLARPLRITLVYSDAAGAVNANPALVNNLNLEVTELDTAGIFRGNVFNNGFSTTGGGFDALNNIECVYVQNPQGVYEVRVLAASVTASARPDIATPWQDFALIVDNAEVPAAQPVNVVPVIDRSGSMVTSGYVDITRTSSKQFVDLMSIDDTLGVVSFGDTGTVEYPTGMAPALETITGQPIRDAAKNEIDGIGFGGCTYMGDGIIKARDLLAGAAGSQAIVMLSDGYDNKGCDAANPAKPSALDAAATLPASLPIYTCAMGPLSDQTLLAQVAADTSGLYYYMPTISDLFEIYNYIRGQVSGNSIIVNDSSTASKSRLAGFVDACSSTVTFTVAWPDASLRYVPRSPQKSKEISIRLRDPRGKLLPDNAAEVRRIAGKGYVVFRLHEPRVGRWYVEVETAGETHTPYTVGGFVDSPITMSLIPVPSRIGRGMPLQVVAQALDKKGPITGYKATAKVIAPVTGIPRLLTKYARVLKTLKADPARLKDMPPDFAKLATLRDKMLKDTKEDLFAHQTATFSVVERSMDYINGQRLNVFLPAAAAPSGISVGQFRSTEEAGTYNVIVRISGFSPACGSRFERQQLVSVVVS